MTPSILTLDDRAADADRGAAEDVSATHLYSPAAAEAARDGGGIAAGCGRNLLGAAIALRAALEQTGDALATPRLASLLESEAGLAAALAVLPADADFGPHRARILHELALARHELRRCRRLGAALAETVKQTLGGRSGPGDYGPDGQVAGLAERTAGTLQTRG